MPNFTITTFDWVPELPRGYVRDIRLRWALEEAGIPYDIELTAFNERENAHYLHQPFGQVPWLSMKIMRYLKVVLVCYTSLNITMS